MVDVLTVALTDLALTDHHPADLVSMGPILLVLIGTTVLTVFFCVVTGHL